MAKGTRSPERTQFLNDLLITAIEGGMTSQWAEFRSIERDEELNIVKAVLVDEYDPVDMAPQSWTVTIDTMAKGLAVHRNDPAFTEQCEGGNGLTLADRTNGEDGDYDAIDADAILQLGLFGKVVFG